MIANKLNLAAKSAVTLLLLSVSFSSCSSRKKRIFQPPSIAVIPKGFPQTQGHTPAMEGDVVRDGGVDAYVVGRYVDPVNNQLMHERHVLYRRNGQRWKLKSDPNREVRIGAVAGLRDTKFEPKSSAEMESTVARQGQELEQTKVATMAIAKSLDNVAVVAEKQSILTNGVVTLSQRLENLTKVVEKVDQKQDDTLRRVSDLERSDVAGFGEFGEEKK